ncbi:PH domain-containing protein [Robertmurraya kyonggiensis]|uniref:Uncharacterized protein n=1 Tax=Robertmurraya kyonggiensis TaxID=1037680 RepID=A0A4U1D3W1_9BACI|nr:PH domain-containing protein [Robertmurraya kyonggiensis]TKC15917.1 hypothetical protein FA727_16185 [Robertmurraya kyonggiensis]
MKFCPECGTKAEGMKFCPECGYKLGEVAAAATVPVETVQPTQNEEQTIAEYQTYMFGMENKKSSIGKFELSVPQFKYILTSQRLLIEKVGVMSKKRDEIELYKVNDIVVSQGLKDKIAGVGDIEVLSSDSSLPTLTLKRIKNPYDVKEAIRKAVMSRKDSMNISYRQEI